MESTQSSTSGNLGDMETEPAKTIGFKNAVIGVVVAVIAVLVILGINVPSGMETGLITLVGAIFALLPYLTALQIRGKVYAPATVDKIKAEQFNAGHRAAAVEQTRSSGRFTRPGQMT